MYVYTHTLTFGYHPSAFPHQSHETLTQPSSQGDNIRTYATVTTHMIHACIHDTCTCTCIWKGLWCSSAAINTDISECVIPHPYQAKP